MPQQEKTSGMHRIVKVFDYLLFGTLVKIDYYITAENDIHLPEKKKPVLVIKIKPAESYQFPDTVRNSESPLLRVEKVVFILLFRNPESRVTVDTLAGLMQN